MPYYYHGPVMPGGRKPTGGKIRKSRGKRRRENGRPPAFTMIGEKKVRPIRVMGGERKLRLISEYEVNIALGNGEIKKVKILSVIENKASKIFTRKKIITKGALVKTELGTIRITSRPGQHGVLNGVLLREDVASQKT